MNKTRRDFLRNLAITWFGAQAAPALANEALADTAKNTDLNIWDAPEAVGRVTRDSAEINVVARQRSEVLFEFGSQAGRLSKKKKITGTGSLSQTFKRLDPGERYYYRVGIRKNGQRNYQYGDINSFITQRPAGQPFSFAVVADSHLYNGPLFTDYLDHITNLADMVSAEDVDFVIFVGDEMYLDGNGLVESQSETNQRWAFWRHVFGPVLANKPAFLSLGNHEGEAGFYASWQRRNPLTIQKWATIARKQYVLNPRFDTYPEGGENDGWFDPVNGGEKEGNASPLENYYSFTWGDAQFTMLDVNRYRQDRGRVESHTIGEQQMKWLRRTLSNSKSKLRFLVAHNVLGGAPYDPSLTMPGGYGRGGAKYANVGEQKKIHRLMRRNGVNFFIYGHDHALVHENKDNINYVCCGKSRRTAWWTNTAAWKEMYGTNFQSVPGYMLFDVNGNEITMRHTLSGYHEYPFHKMLWDGKTYPVNKDGTITVENNITQMVRVWDKDDTKKNDLLKDGGSFRKNVIHLPKGSAQKITNAKVMYVGQESFRKTIRFNKQKQKSE